MLNLKKMLIAGTVLTAFCAHAFAAEAPATNEQQAPTMKERVAAILHHDENDGKDFHKKFKKDKQGPKLTAEQKAEHKKLKKAWKSMTPEQRQQAFEKMQQDRKEAHDKYAKETMDKLTDTQKAEVEQFIKDDMAQRQARKARLDNMTPEQREAVKANRPMPPKPSFKDGKGFDKHHKEFGKHHKGEFRGEAPHDGPHHPGEMPPAPQDMMD